MIINNRISKPKGLVLDKTGVFDLIFIVESKAIGIYYTDHIKIRLYQINYGAFINMLSRKLPRFSSTNSSAPIMTSAPQRILI